MKITKTEFKKDVNGSSSWIIYICKTSEEAMEVGKAAFSVIETMSSQDKEWYATMSICKVLKDCRVPEFFHDHGYWCSVIEHNNGDWGAKPNYTLYIVG